MPQENQNLYAAPTANVEGPQDEVDIDALNVSDTWKKRFKALQMAGGPSMHKRKEMSKEDAKALAFFNILGFLFGPIYYFSKGMWKKGLTLFVLVFVCLLIFDVVMVLVGFGQYRNVANYAGPAVFAIRANFDYYKKMVLGDNGWW